MTEQDVIADPYAGLPAPVVAEMASFAKTASHLTVAMAVGIFVPAALLFVLAFGIVKVVQSSNLLRQFPELRSPEQHFPGRRRSELRAIAMRHENLKRVLEFRSARRGFWAAIIGPLVLVGAITAIVVGLG